MNDALSSALPALGAIGKEVNLTANNIANVNTEGFRKSRAIFQDTDPSNVTVFPSQGDTPNFPVLATVGTLK